MPPLNAQLNPACPACGSKDLRVIEFASHQFYQCIACKFWTTDSSQPWNGKVPDVG